MKKSGNKYNAVLGQKTKMLKEKHICGFETKEEAYKCYIKEKEKYILDILEFYKKDMPLNVYDTIKNFVNNDYLTNMYNH